MPTPRIEPKFSATTSNYVSSDGALQTINTARVSAPLWKGATLSGDIGANTNVNFSGGKAKTTLFLQTKLDQKLNSNFKTYLRYRKYGSTDQLRLGGEYSYPINKKLSLYADGYYTTKFEKGKDTFGCFVGADYKVNKHLSLWFEPFQKNFSVKNPTINGWKDGQWLINAGASYKF